MWHTTTVFTLEGKPYNGKNEKSIICLCDYHRKESTEQTRSSNSSMIPILKIVKISLNKELALSL
jgi:hypothetical protein